MCNEQPSDLVNITHAHAYRKFATHYEEIYFVHNK